MTPTAVKFYPGKVSKIKHLKGVDGEALCPEYHAIEEAEAFARLRDVLAKKSC